MPTYLLILTILISVVFAGCSVVGILNKKIRKKVEIIQSDNISDDDVEKVEDDSEAADQNLISDLDLSLVEQKTESDKRKSNSVFLHVFRAVPFYIQVWLHRFNIHTETCVFDCNLIRCRLL